MLVSGETSANQPRKLSRLWPGRQFLFELELGVLRKRLRRALRFIPQALLMPMRFHALAALMLGNFRLASFLK